MPIARNVHVQGKDGTLVLPDRAGQTVTVSTEQTVQKQGSLMARGALCGLPKRQLAPGCGFKTRQSSSDSRNAVLTGAPADLWPKRTGPHTRSQRPQEVEALSLRPRFETDGPRSARAETCTPRGVPGRARRVGRGLAAAGLSKQHGCHRPPCPPPCHRGERRPRRRLPAAATRRAPARHRTCRHRPAQTRPHHDQRWWRLLPPLSPPPGRLCPQRVCRPGHAGRAPAGAPRRRTHLCVAVRVSRWYARRRYGQPR
jgi:hypothetical protein